jgi:hypothetical protein
MSHFCLAPHPVPSSDHNVAPPPTAARPRSTSIERQRRPPDRPAEKKTSAAPEPEPGRRRSRSAPRQRSRSRPTAQQEAEVLGSPWTIPSVSALSLPRAFAGRETERMRRWMTVHQPAVTTAKKYIYIREPRIRQVRWVTVGAWFQWQILKAGSPQGLSSWSTGAK